MLVACSSHGEVDDLSAAIEAPNTTASSKTFATYIDSDMDVAFETADKYETFSSSTNLANAFAVELGEVEVTQSDWEESDEKARLELRVRGDNGLFSVSLRFLRDHDKLVLHRVRIVR